MLPPGPRTPPIWQTYRHLRDPLAYARKLSARYGDAVRVRSLNGRGIAVGSPELARIAFAADPENFATVSVLADIFGPRAVIATTGPTHKRQRKLLNPRFSGARMKTFLAAMQRVTREHFASFASAKGVVVMLDVTQALTVDVILETIFGGGGDFDRAEGRRVLVDAIRAFSPLTFASPLLRSRFSPPMRKLHRARRALDAWVDSHVAERRRATSFGNDILGVLLEARYEDGAPMEEAEIKDQIYTLLIAGHETTAVSMAWGVYWLLREPAVLEKLRESLRSAKDVEALVKQPYLQAVCSEALRIEPVVTDIARKCKRPLPLGKWTVPAGENVFVNMGFMLRDERLYPEPHRFRPERFLERRYAPSEFAPFGGGERRCLGAAFAETELAIALATIALEWDLELASGKPERAVRRHITMGPKYGVRVLVRGRREAGTKATSGDRARV